MFVQILALIDVAEAIEQAFRSLFGLLCVPVYNLIVIFYDLFSYIARAEVLSNGMVEEVYRKVGMLLGIFMTFKLIFSLIQSLIDPSKLNDKRNGYVSIIYRCLISIVLLGITPTIFDMAFDLQNTIIGNSGDSSNIIYRLIVEDNSNFNSDTFGRKLATELYFGFYKEAPGYNFEPGTFVTENGIQVDSYETLKELTAAGNVSFYDLALKLSADDDNTYNIEFDGILCLVVGIATVYFLLTFCIQTAVRVFQLAYLQLIAPVPIISYISDSEGTFKKWTSQCLSTYLDLFIRLAIIYFIVYLSNSIISNFNPENISYGTDEELFAVAVEVFLILGLLLFAKKVPSLIKDLFPNMGGGAGKFSFGLNPKKDLIEPLKPLTAPIGWIGKKGIGALERRMYNLPKPKSKLRQSIEKTFPGYAEYGKALDERRKFEKEFNEGRQIDSILNGTKLDVDTPIETFRKLGFNDAWVNAYKNESIASDNVNKIEQELERAKARGDSEAVGRLTGELGAAKRNHKKYKEALDYQNGQHKRDAERMANYKLYKSRTGTVEKWKSSTPDSNQQSGIVVPDSVSNSSPSLAEQDRREQNSAEIQREIDASNASVSDRVNNATNLSDSQRSTADSLQQELANLIAYKEQARDQKDRAEIDRDIQKIQAELDNLLK